jgi:ABC-2 type transport system permease protein
MESFKASFAVEVEKMYRRKKAVIILIMSILIIIFVQLITTVLRSNLGIIGNTASGFPITVLSVFSKTILPLFTALVVIDTFTGEFANNTMKIVITKPVSRLKIYVSKLAATSFFVLANLLVVMVLSIIVGAVFSIETVTLSGVLRAVAAYVVTFVPIMIIAVVIAFLANFFKSSAIVFFMSIIIYAVSQVFGVVLTSYSNLFITTSLDWYKLWIANSLPLGEILRQILYMAGYVLIFFTAGFYRFDKRDL